MRNGQSVYVERAFVLRLWFIGIERVRKMAGKKRSLEEVDVSEIDCGHQEVTVHGVITELSPVKVSRKNEQVKYFGGKLSDGKKTMRVVSFAPALRNPLEKARVEGTPIALVNCQVKESPVQFQSGGKFEILASTRSKVERSPQKFKLPEDMKSIDPESGAGQEILLKDLEAIAVKQHVTVSFKVVSVESPVDVTTKAGKKLVKQECLIADVTGTTRLVLWQGDVGKLEVERCYKVGNLTVGMYLMVKYLSMS